MMITVTTPKKMPMSFQVITFLSKVASGNESPTTAIINARAVPMYPSEIGRLYQSVFGCELCNQKRYV